MNNKILRILGKKGRITIPFAIRMRIGIGYNDVISFEEKDRDTIILKKERLCNGCSPECLTDNEDTSIEAFIDNLTPSQQRKAFIHLNLLWAEREGVKLNGNT